MGVGQWFDLLKGIYQFMNHFVPPKSFLNPIRFDRMKNRDNMKPVYRSLKGYQRVLNTRNPFRRILAAYTDKFFKTIKSKSQFGDYWNAARLAEKDEFDIPKKYSASFHAFLRNAQSIFL